MYNHASQNYICPICLGIQGIENENTLIKQTDIIYKNKLITVFINSFFIEGNEGHVIIVPNKHIENIYDVPNEYASTTLETAQKMAIVLKKAYNCDGITLLQNNEPAGNQHAFHFHLHVFPRYKNDNLFQNMMNKKTTTPEERLLFIEKLKKSLI